MSGIAAVYNRLDPEMDPARLATLMAHVAWRGPDHSGTWHDRYVGLGAAQLWTTPEDWDTRQPVVSEGARTALVFDGRLDNRPELASDLRLDTDERASMSDAEIALRAYARWGESFPRRLAGPFSLAVWDADRRQLLCARDPIGQRPLYYRATSSQVDVASTIDALRSLPGSTSLNDDYIWDYLCTSGTLGSFDPEETPFADIRRLPAGHTLVVTPGTLRVVEHWQPWGLPPLRYRDDREYLEHLRALLTEVVRANNRAAGPVCATLSGGLDSSSVVCLTRELERAGGLSGEPIETLTLAWRETPDGVAGYDERAFAEAVIDKHSGPAHFLSERQMGSFDFFADSPTRWDEPFSLFGGLWSGLAEKANELGSRVLLAGTGGDHLLSGNHFYLADMVRRGAWRQVARILRHESSGRHLPYPGLVAGYLVAPHLPRHLGARLLEAVTKEFDRRRIDSVYYWHVPEWVRQREWLERRGPRRHRLLGRRFASHAAQRDFEELAVGARDHRLLPLYNLALSYGVDLRNPFLDVRLADFCLRLPPRLKYRDGLTKVALRGALGDVLPREVAQRRGKTAYDFAVADHVKRNWTTIQDAYRDSAAERHGYIDAAALLGAIAPLQQGGGGAQKLPPVVAAFGLEDWLRRIESPAEGGASVGAGLSPGVGPDGLALSSSTKKGGEAHGQQAHV